MFVHLSLNYKNNEYTVCQYQHNSRLRYFIIDTEDLDKIKNYNWQIFNKHIGTIVNGQVILLHNLIMKGDKLIHYNKNICDNRKKNLVNVSQFYKNKGERKELPDYCNIDVNDIPKSVWFCKQTNNFMSDIYYKDITKKYSSISFNKVSYEFKFEEIKAYLRFLRDNYEYFDELKYNNNTIKTIKSLKQFNDILIKSKLKNYDKSFVEIPEYVDYLKEKRLLNKDERKLLESVKKHFEIDCSFSLKISMDEDKYIINNDTISKNKKINR